MLTFYKMKNDNTYLSKSLFVLSGEWKLPSLYVYNYAIV